MKFNFIHYKSLVGVFMSIIRKATKKIVKKSSKLNDLFYIKGFGIKFTFRLYLFNLFINFISGRKQKKFNYAHYTSRVISEENLHLEGSGKGTYSSMVASGACYIQAGNGVYIGEGTIWAPNVAIISANHDLDKDNKEWKYSDSVRIGKNCWIGTKAIILPGVNIGNGCTIAAGAVVTKTFEGDNLTLAGVPAKIIKKD
ncbi:TPA: hypothetical protein P0E14_003181 [Vibrio harveyi]|nr:hypothetical protein [Vibrio harveyi]